MSGESEGVEDRVLVRDFLKTRDETAFRKLYHQHAGRLYQLALRLVQWVETDAEEAVQEAWIRAVRHLPGFRWESSFYTWLAGILIHCCRDVTRKRTREPLHQETEAIMSYTPNGYTIDLERAISSLSDGYRVVFLLHDLEGYTHGEIGDLLGIDAGTSKSQLFHARRILRAHFEGTKEKKK